MKRTLGAVSCVFIVVIILVPLSCRKHHVQQPYFTTLSSEQVSPDQSGLYTKAEALFSEKKYDEVIKTLSGPAYSDPMNFKLNVLLAKAQVEKCVILKEKGDLSYKALVLYPYETGKRFHEIQAHPELYYIVAKCLLINDRYFRAKRTINKALYYSPNNPDYLLVLGDAYFVLAKMKKEDPYREKQMLSKAKAAYEKAVELKGEVKSYVDIKLQQISEKLK